MKVCLSVVLVLSALTWASANKIISDEFIAKINAQQSTWTAKKNFPDGTTEEYLRSLVGTFRPTAEARKHIPIKVHDLSQYDIPASFDSRQQWPQCGTMNEIRNQGACGSCWAFGASEAMSDRLCIHKNEYYQVSSEDLLECCTECGNGCGGGYTGRAWDYWVSNGITSGSDVGSGGCKPYKDQAFVNGQTPGCDNFCVDGEDYGGSKRYGASHYSINYDVGQIQAEIMTNGPVEVTYHVYEDFYNYNGGVYSHTSGGDVGYHAVKVIGWGEENGSPFWLVANSWGPGWGGIGGFFKILRGNNECEIETWIDAGLPR